MFQKSILLFVIMALVAAAPAMAADDSDVAARAAMWEKEFNASNFEAIAAMYAEDGCRMPPNQETVRGREAIVQYFQAGKERGIAKVKITVNTSESSGDLSYGSGTSRIFLKDGSLLHEAKWMSVSKRINGTWKILCDIWNLNTPMPAPSTR